MTAISPIRVALVEDLAELRQTLRELLASDTGVLFVGAWETAEAALPALPAAQPDVVLMDINLPGMSGVEAVRQLKALLPSTEFLMLTIFEDHESVYQSLLAGATGYLVKRSTPEELLAAIRELHAGGSPMSASIARKVVKAFASSGRTPAETENLTPREEEILRRLGGGARYKEIAQALGISHRTVNGHLRVIYRKLQVRTKSEAIGKFHGRSR